MSRPVYVGRERELAELADLLDEAIAGHGAQVLVTGEPGAGKTALVERFSLRCRDAVVRWAACWEGEGQPPYWPWTQVMRQELSAGARPAGRDAAELARFVPELGIASPAEGSRFEVYDALARFLAERCKETPRLVIVEDVHWADEASVGFLGFLARQLPRLPMLVVATARDTDVQPATPLHAALPVLSLTAARIVLGGLAPAEVAELLAALTGRPIDAGLAAEVVLESGGNPLFATELGRLLATQAGGPVPVPSAVVDVIEQRLARLPREGGELLRTAAVVGLQFEIADVAEAVGTDQASVLQALGPYVNARIVHVDERVPSRLAFTHALVRRALIDRLPPLGRARRHAAVADVLEHRSGNGAEYLARLADHLVAALPLTDRSRAVRAARLAGDEAVATLAFADAARRYQQALELVAGTLHADEKVRLDLLLTLGEAQWHAGAGSASQSTFFSAADLARRLGDADAFARATLGAALHWARFDRRPDLVGLLEEALRLLPSGDAIRRVEVLARLGERLPPWTDRIDECDRVGREAIAMARRLGDPVALALALRAGDEALHSCDSSVERRRMAEEQLTLARQAADPELAGEANRALFTVALELADRPALDRALVGLASATSTLRRPYWQYEHLKAVVAVALLEGRIDDALAARRQITDLSQWSEVAEVGAVLALELVVAGADFELPSYGQTVEAFCGLYRRTPVLRAAAGGGSALGLVHLGREEEAEAIVHDVLAAVDDVVLRRFAVLGGCILLARAAARLGITQDLDRLYRVLSPYEDQAGIIARGAVCVGPVAQGLGVVAGALGDISAAEAHFARADQVASDMRAPAWRARNAAELARVFWAAGEHDRAVPALRTARRLGHALGMTRLLRELEALEPTPNRRPRPQVTLAASLVLDGDLWTVRHGGLAARLRDSKGLRYLAELVSHPGVERHVLDLVALTEGAPTDAGLQRRHLGDAGPALDERAKAAYKRRLLDLREDVADAEEFNDLERAARARAEIEALAAELSRAVGLGGRDRRLASAAERARLNVTRALRAAIARIEESVPDLGAHLDRRVRTGLFCAYEPTPDDSVPWA